MRRLGAAGTTILIMAMCLAGPACDTVMRTGLPNSGDAGNNNADTGQTGDGSTIGGGRPTGGDSNTNSGGDGTLIGGSTAVAADTLSDLEQLMLERINRARLLPAREANRNNIAIDEGIPGELNTNPKPAAAYNKTLATAARRHADDMLANDFFAHENLSGQSPFDRIRAAGYSFSTAGENLAWRGTTGPVDEDDTTEKMHTDLFVDAGIEGRGHRKVMLSENFREVGVSVRRGVFTSDGTDFDSMIAVQNYGTDRDGATFFVLGVVYRDANNNGQYDFGEGAANASVFLDGENTTTASGGGFTFSTSAGDHTIRFPNGRTRNLTIIDQNVKVDFVDGTTIDVNLGLGEF
jgi:uncharacterized protein YkwD